MALKSKRIELGNGIFLNMVHTDKFKSNLLSYYFVRPLLREEVTMNSLLPVVLKRGTEKLNTSLEIEKELEEMYGTNLSISVNKRGERHVLRFSMEWADGSYLDDDKYSYDVINMLKDIIYKPYLEDGVFKKEYVNLEKDNLKSRIESKINDKRSYAINRCIEEMCKNEKFSIYQLGYVEDLESINEQNLYDHYKNVLDTSSIEIYYVGKYDEDLIDYLSKENSINRDNIISIPRENIITQVQNKNRVNEELDVNQGKLVMGYRTGIPYEDKLYNALLLASDILGGGPNSKLFKNVREAESLAYYTSSSILKYKSLMIIDAGIEFDKFERTVEIINKQLEDLKDGLFTNDDIEISKKAIKTSSESIRDSIFLISEFFFSQGMSNDPRSLEQILDDYEEVSKEEIISAAKTINIDTIYFMKNKK